MYADLQNVEFHTLLMQIMIKVQIKFCLLSFYLFIHFVTDSLTYHLHSSSCHVQCSHQRSRPHFVKSNRLGQQAFLAQNFSFLYWCMSDVPQGNPAHNSTPPPQKASVLVGRQRQQPTPAGGPEATAAAATTADVATAEPPMKCCAKL